MTASPQLFELKVIVEADGWHDVAALVASVDEALEPHRDGRTGDRRWSVVAAPLPEGRARELRWFVEDADAHAGEPSATDRMSA